MVPLIFACVLIRALSLVDSQTVTKGPRSIFVYQGDITVTHDSWLLTLCLPLGDYATHIQTLHEEMGMFSKVVDDFQHKAENNSTLNEVRDTIIVLIQQEVEQFNDEIFKLNKIYRQVLEVVSIDTFGTRATKRTRRSVRVHNREMQSIQSRSLRALLPFMGPILGAMFGTLSKGDLRAINRNINLLKDQTDSMAHVLEESLSLINSTMAEVQNNRKILITLVETVDSIKRKLKQLTRIVMEEIELTYFLNQMHGMFHMATASLRQVGQSIGGLKDNLQMALKGHLSMTMVDNAQLSTLLKGIKRKLPALYSLPYALRRLDLYYKYAPVQLMSNGSTIILAIMLPLVRDNAVYELFKAIQVPGEEPQGGLTRYRWEGEFVAVTKNRNYYMTLSKQEAEKCGGEEITFCKSTSPIYNATTMPSCILSLLKQEMSTAETVCTKYPVDRAEPEIQHLFDGKWLMFMLQEERVEIDCLNPRPDQTIYIPPGISIFNQDANCQALSRYWVLPVRFRDHSSAKVKNFYDIQIAELNHVLKNVTMDVGGNDGLDRGIPRRSPVKLDFFNKIQELEQSLKVKYQLEKNGIGLLVEMAARGWDLYHLYNHIFLLWACCVCEMDQEQVWAWFGQPGTST